MEGNLSTAIFEELKNIFPNRTTTEIQQIITIVQENLTDTPEIQFESMVNLLIGNNETSQEIVSDEEEGAVGYQNNIQSDLLNLFPDICPLFLKNFLNQQKIINFDNIVDQLTTDGYDIVELDCTPLWQHLKQILPNANPRFLQKKAQELCSKSQRDIENFIEDLIKSNDYPTMQDYLKRKQIEDQLQKYTKNFNVEEFLKLFPNPEEYFSNPKRLNHLHNENYAIKFLYNKYPYVRTKYIDKIYENFKENLIAVCDRLDRYPKSRRIPREKEILEDVEDVELLQQFAYLQNRKQIKYLLEIKNETYRMAKDEAIKFGLLQSCQCCYIDELIPEECYTCRKGCVFCKECVEGGVRIIIGKGELKFPCFNNCDSEFSLSILQMILFTKIFENLMKNIQKDELLKANVEGIDSCPFCGNILTVSDEEKLLKCNNIDCMRESCRECKHESHVPLHCNEVEYDEDVTRRTFVENKMTEALLRICWKCSKPFIKSNGCNKMTCHCGAIMCYLCGAAIQDYSHFGGSCPLFTNDSEVDLRRVINGVKQAKTELGNVEIKFDPAKDLPKTA